MGSRTEPQPWQGSACTHHKQPCNLAVHIPTQVHAGERSGLCVPGTRIRRHRYHQPPFSLTRHPPRARKRTQGMLLQEKPNRPPPSSQALLSSPRPVRGRKSRPRPSSARPRAGGPAGYCLVPQPRCWGLQGEAWCPIVAFPRCTRTGMQSARRAVPAACECSQVQVGGTHDLAQRQPILGTAS